MVAPHLPDSVTIVKENTQTTPVFQFKADHAAQDNLAETAVEKPIPSDGNPCPFLRGLVAQGLLPDIEASGQQIVEAVKHIERLKEPGGVPVPAIGLKAAAAVGNGFSPWQVAHNLRHGVHIDQLRYGPLYKNGVHSGILTEQSTIDHHALAYVKSCARLKQTGKGDQELGLDRQEIETMLDGFYAKSDPNVRKARYRPIMSAEWQVLLDVIGTEGLQGRYLRYADIERLFIDHEFPTQIQSRLNKQSI